MRTKARKSLERLKTMRTEKRKSTLFNETVRTNWHECPLGSIGLQKYVTLVSWCNRNVSKKYSRGEMSLWFEDEKDLFKFKLRWGNSDDE